MPALIARLAILLLVTAAAPVIALVADGQPVLDSASDDGLYVWRTWSGDWQLRAMAASIDRRLTGSFQTSEPVVSSRALSLESDDVLRVTGTHTLDFDLHTTRRTVDGLVFSAGRGDVCLRTAADLPIHVGHGRVPVRSPVDLTGTGACLSAAPVSRPSQLEIRRLSKLDWQVRLAPVGAAARFDGTIETSEPLASYRAVSFEGGDRLWQRNPTTLQMHLETWPGGYDEVDFTTVEFDKVCLRSSGGNEQIVSLIGNGQRTPDRAATPVDLTNNGACGLPTSPFPPPIHERRFNPGHYVVLSDQDDATSIAESVVPGVAGFVRRYKWRTLEPAPGHYDFSAIEADLASVSTHGLQLVALIVDKTFNHTSPTPDYLRDRTLTTINGGNAVVRWDPYVVTRYEALIDALGQRFDANPRFEGIATEESAHGLNDAAMQATGYTPERYRDVLIDELGSAARSFPHARVFWFMNYLWGANFYLGEIAREVAPLGVVMGGPDVLPDDPTLQLQPYPFYDGAVGHMPLFGQVEPSCYQHPHADTSYPTTYWTPAELFDYARDRLHVSYMFWGRWRWKKFPDSYDWWDAIPVIEENPVFNR